MSSDDNAEMTPTQEEPPSRDRKKMVMSEASISHLLKSRKASSEDLSMYHLIAGLHNEHEAQDIARRAGWDIGSEAQQEPFTQADFEAALRKVGRKIANHPK